MAKETQQASELVVKPSSDLVALDDFDAIILGQRDAPPPEIVEDPSEISREIMMQLLAAESDEQLQNFGNATSWRELLGTPIHITGFRWRPSTFDEGGPVYVIVTGFRMDTGDQVVLTTGAANVLAQLSNLARRGRLGEADCVWSLQEADRQTQRGFLPLHLEKVSRANG